MVLYFTSGGTMKHLVAVVLMAFSMTVAGAASVGEGDGVVVEVSQQDGIILLEHGEIENMMGPMTMQFTVDDRALLEGVQEGDTVDFTVEWRQPADFVITRLRVVSSPAKP
jgi:Cu/Ag efflux protein CusF